MAVSDSGEGGLLWTMPGLPAGMDGRKTIKVEMNTGIYFHAEVGTIRGLRLACTGPRYALYLVVGAVGGTETSEIVLLCRDTTETFKRIFKIIENVMDAVAAAVPAPVPPQPLAVQNSWGGWGQPHYIHTLNGRLVDIKESLRRVEAKLSK